MIPKHEILLALTGEDGLARGSLWRITAKKTDFYLDFIGRENGGIHLSVHGPNERFDSHRFHIRTDRRRARQTRYRGVYLEKALDKGVEVKGVQLKEHAYHVARLRWTWDLQRPRYREAALARVPLPNLDDTRDGFYQRIQLGQNYGWDIDLVISYDKPYWIRDTFWSKQKQIGPDSPRIGPIKNDAGMYLTATSIHNSIVTSPAPAEHLLPRPKSDEDAQVLTVGGFGEGKLKDLWWFEERIVSKDFMRAFAFHTEDVK